MRSIRLGPKLDLVFGPSLLDQNGFLKYRNIGFNINILAILRVAIYWLFWAIYIGSIDYTLRPKQLGKGKRKKRNLENTLLQISFFAPPQQLVSENSLIWSFIFDMVFFTFFCLPTNWEKRDKKRGKKWQKENNPRPNTFGPHISTEGKEIVTVQTLVDQRLAVRMDSRRHRSFSVLMMYGVSDVGQQRILFGSLCSDRRCSSL